MTTNHHSVSCPEFQSNTQQKMEHFFQQVAKTTCTVWKRKDLVCLFFKEHEHAFFEFLSKFETGWWVSCLRKSPHEHIPVIDQSFMHANSLFYCFLQRTDKQNVCQETLSTNASSLLQSPVGLQSTRSTTLMNIIHTKGAVNPHSCSAQCSIHDQRLSILPSCHTLYTAQTIVCTQEKTIWHWVLVFFSLQSCSHNMPLPCVFPVPSSHQETTRPQATKSRAMYLSSSPENAGSENKGQESTCLMKITLTKKKLASNWAEGDQMTWNFHQQELKPNSSRRSPCVKANISRCPCGLDHLSNWVPHLKAFLFSDARMV